MEAKSDEAKRRSVNFGRPTDWDRNPRAAMEEAVARMKASRERQGRRIAERERNGTPLRPKGARIEWCRECMKGSGKLVRAKAHRLCNTHYMRAYRSRKRRDVIGDD